MAEKDTGDIFLNIIILYNPNPNYYKKTQNLVNRAGINTLSSITKSIPLMEQFKAFYYSIKKNIKVPHQISIVHKDPFNEKDLEILNNLDVDLLKPKTSGNDLYILRDLAWSRYIVETKIKGTHRLNVETDMLMLQNPDFDWNVDFQFNYAGNHVFPKKEIENVIKKHNLKPLSSLYNYNLAGHFANHYNIEKMDYRIIPPHVNNGAILIKEEVAISLYNNYIHVVNDLQNMMSDKHLAEQLLVGPILLSHSDNWRPFKPGINYLLKLFDVNKFGKNNIQLLHYCGSNAAEIAVKHFPEYFMT